MFSAQTNNTVHSVMCSCVSCFLSSSILFSTVVVVPNAFQFNFYVLMMNLDAFGQIRLAALNWHSLVSMDRLFRFNCAWMIQMMCPPTIIEGENVSLFRNSRTFTPVCSNQRWRSLIKSNSIRGRACTHAYGAHSRKSRWRPVIDFLDQIFLSTNCLKHSRSYHTIGFCFRKFLPIDRLTKNYSNWFGFFS